MERAGLSLVEAGMVTADWHAHDKESLIRGVLSGQTGSRNPERDAAIVNAARPFAVADGYALRNVFRFAVGSRPAGL